MRYPKGVVGDKDGKKLVHSDGVGSSTTIVSVSELLCRYGLPPLLWATLRT